MLIKQTRHLHLVKRLFMPVIVIGLFVVSIVSYSPNIKATAGVPGNPAFTDINFYTCVLTKLDSMNAKPSADELTKNNRIATGAEVYNATDYELGLVTYLSCSGQYKTNDGKITSINGVEKITSLDNLDVSDNLLTGVEMTNNAALVKLYLYRNQLSSIDVTKNLALETLSAWENQLSDINVEANIALTSLTLDNNKLTSIDLSKNMELEFLDLSYNQLTSLDLLANINLTNLWVYENNISIFDLQNNINLEFLAIADNTLASLDLSKNTKLKGLMVGNLFGTNKSTISNLDLSNNVDLSTLYIANDQALTGLTISGDSLKIDDVDEPIIIDAPNIKLVKVVYGDNNKAFAYRAGRVVKVNPDSLVNGLPSFQLAQIQTAFSSRYFTSSDENGDINPYIRYVYPTSEITITNSSGDLLVGSDILKNGDLLKFLYDQESSSEDESAVRYAPISLPIAVNGDVVSDGEIKIGDVAKLYRHFRGRDVMTDEVLLAAGDVIADGEIKIGDVAQLYRYFRGRISSL